MLSELSATVPSEPGSLDYEAFGTEESATTFYVKESWSSREDLDRHARLVETSGDMERAAKLLATPLATVTLREI
jgi:quinol monooxygenase YgiN